MYKEYFYDENGKVEIKNLRSLKIPQSEYILMHQKLPIICHDVFIKHGNGVLLVKRKKAPGNGLIWPIGGRLERGRTVEESLRRKVKEECGLRIRKIKFLGMGRHFFGTDPFNHHRGADTPTLVFSAEGYGRLKLDKFHENPLIFKKEEYKKLKSKLHPYVSDFLKIALSIK